MNLSSIVILVTLTIDCTCAAYILRLQSNYITKRQSADYPISRAILE